MRPSVKAVLAVGGLGMAAAALVHVVALIGGPVWMALLGAPPAIVRSSQDGTWPASATTLGIAGLLGVFAAYAFSGIGWIRPLPWRGAVLAGVAAIMIMRGLLVVPMLTQANLNVFFDQLHVVLSLVVLLLGCAYAVGWYGLRRAE